MFTRFSARPLAAFIFLLSSGFLFAQRPLGVDVSSFQTDTAMDWPSMKSGGITFAWAKATEGGSTGDSQYTAHMANGKAAGIYMGSYHYAHPELNSAATEASHFWGRAATYTLNDGHSLNPMLDIEGNAFSGNVGASSVSDWINQWCTAIEQDAAGQNVTLKPAIYISECNANHLDTTVSQLGSDIAHYDANDPLTSSPWTGTGCNSSAYEVWGSGVWNFWQYSSTGGITGYANNIDKDVFNGTLATLQTTQVLGGGGPQITNQPDSVVAAPGTNVSFTVGCIGSSLHFQWRFNTTNIAGATASSYALSPIDITNAGNYSVVINNSAGTTTSAFGYLSVAVPPTNAPGAVIAPTGLVDFWDGQADTADSFGTNTATANGNFFYAPGRPGLGFHFDGTSAYLTTAANSLPVPWTLALWVNRQNAAGASASLLSDGTNAVKMEQFNASRQLGITKFGVGDYTFGVGAPAGSWTHLTFVGTSTGTSLYINGALQSSLTNSQPLPRAYMGVTHITSTGAILDYMSGNVDEVLVFNRALSATEISSIYNAGTAGLVRAPELTSITVSGHTAQLNMRGLTGKTFTIFRSPDLTNWTNLGRLSAPSGTLQYFDSTGGAPQFTYELTQP